MTTETNKAITDIFFPKDVPDEWLIRIASYLLGNKETRLLAERRTRTPEVGATMLVLEDDEKLETYRITKSDRGVINRVALPWIKKNKPGKL